MLNRILFTAGCIALPVIWGVVVNWVFNLWHKRAVEKPDDEPVFPDYQI